MIGKIGVFVATVGLILNGSAIVGISDPWIDELGTTIFLAGVSALGVDVVYSRVREARNQTKASQKDAPDISPR